MSRMQKGGSILGIRGYTIVEAMIFLAVSGGLLVSAMTMISGRQERVRFLQSIDRVEQDLKDAMNDVSTGYYASEGNFRCGSTGGVVSWLPGSANQGTNSGCIFMGKNIQLGSLPDKTVYHLQTIVGARSATDLSSSGAKLLGVGGNPGRIESKSIPVDVEIVKIVSKTDTTRNFSGIALVSEFARTSAVDQTIAGNASRVTVYEYSGPYNDSPVTANPNNFKAAPQGVIVCLRQRGSSTNIASLTVGASGQLSIAKTVDTWPTECN